MSLQIFYNRKSVIYTHIVLADGDGVGAGNGFVDRRMRNVEWGMGSGRFSCRWSEWES